MPRKHAPSSHLYSSSSFDLQVEKKNLSFETDLKKKNFFRIDMENWFWGGLISVLQCTRKTCPQRQTPKEWNSHRCFLCGANLSNPLSSITTMPEARKMLQQSSVKPATPLQLVWCRRYLGKLLKSWRVRQGLGRIKMKIARHHSHPDWHL